MSASLVFPENASLSLRATPLLVQFWTVDLLLTMTSRCVIPSHALCASSIAFLLLQLNPGESSSLVHVYPLAWCVRGGNSAILGLLPLVLAERPPADIAITSSLSSSSPCMLLLMSRRGRLPFALEVSEGAVGMVGACTECREPGGEVRAVGLFVGVEMESSASEDSMSWSSDIVATAA